MSQQHAVTRRRSYSRREPLFDSPNVEAFELRPYRVLLMYDKYDKDMGRCLIELRASGPNDARNQGLQQLRDLGHTAPCVLRVEEIA